MNSQFGIQCDCCGLINSPTSDGDCPNCGYPVTLEKEERFLADNLRNLQRVATYGGASLPVRALIARYQDRQNYLWRLRTQQTTPSVAPPIAPQQPGSTANIFPVSETFGTGHTKPVAPVEYPITPSPVVGKKLPEKLPVSQEPVQPFLQIPSVEVMPPLVPHKTARTFSPKAFFADQTINIVSSLGAFLILIGSLSFVVTTPNLELSFLTLLVVHALFGIMGAITRRFKSFRTVSVIYTAIFALQVPLVGFAGYRLVSGNVIQFSPSGLVAIAAIYAAIVYSALAIYQRFQPFAYLAAVSMTVVDIALTIAFQLDYEWCPSTLMLLALASLVCVSPTTTKNAPVTKSWDILFQPVQLLMKVYVYLAYLSVGIVGLIALQSNSIGAASIGNRFSIACTLLLLFCWTALFVWRSRLTTWLLTEPYVFIACVLALAYACSFAHVSYVLVLVGLVLLYHGIDRLAQKELSRVPRLSKHMEFLVLVLVCVIPFVVDALLPFRVLARSDGLTSWNIAFPSEVAIDIVALLLCTVVTGSIIISHTGWRKSPPQETKNWLWLLLLSGALFAWGYNLAVLAFKGEPIWYALALTCLLLSATVYVRRSISAIWAGPLDVLTLVFALQTLLLSILQGRVVLQSLLLAFAAVSYGMALYQRRTSLFVLTLTFALLAYIPLSGSPRVLLILCLALPFTWAILQRVLPLRPQLAENSNVPAVFRALFWTFPVLVISLVYALGFLVLEVYRPVSTLGQWLQMELPIALELALFACVWYSAAVIGRMKLVLVPALFFACWALLFPTNTPLLLACIAFGAILLAVAVSRLADKDWSLPLYVIGLLAAVVLAWSDQPQQASWEFLSFGIFLYVISILEPTPWLATGMRWLTVVAVTWSLYNAGLLHEYIWAPLVALAGATLGIGVRLSATLISPTLSDKTRLWSYAGPLYATALAAAILTGLAGTLLGIAQPFYGAIPTALFMYAVIAYGISLQEKHVQGTFLTAGFAIWGMLLATQMPVTYCITMGIIIGLGGLLCSRVLKLDGVPLATCGPLVRIQWNWPWYLTALLAAVLTAGWNLFARTPVDPVLLENGLLAFAALTYVVVFVEGIPTWGWIGISLATLSLIETAIRGDLLRLVYATVFFTLIAVLARLVKPVNLLLRQLGTQHQRSNLSTQLYSIAFTAAILSGIVSAPRNMNVPFYAATPLALILYGLIIYVVTLWEKRSWSWWSAGFIIWGVCLLPNTANCQFQFFTVNSIACSGQSWTVPLTTALLTGVTVISAALGLIIGQLSISVQAKAQNQSSTTSLAQKFAWSGPWYLVSLVSLVITLDWCATMSALMPGYTLATILALFAGLVFVVMLIERLPDLSLLAIALAIWSIAQTGWANWQIAVAYSVLCLLVFAGQFLWQRTPPALKILPPTPLLRCISLSGLGIVILTVIAQGGLSSQAGLLAQSGVFAVCIGALLLWATATLLPSTANKLARYTCYYSAGLLLSLTIPWELLAFGQTDLAWLTLAPASYMIITSPFLIHDKQSSELRRMGHGLALCGAILLLLPTLWSSFSHEDVFPTFFLAIEALLLFLLGAGLRMRFFILSGAALVIVSAIHLLFLPTLGIPTFLALILAGMVLLALATILLVVRTRLATLWSELK